MPETLPYPEVAPGDEPPHDVDGMMWWLVRRQWRTLTLGALFGIPWMLTIALVPAAIGKAVDEGIVAHDTRALLLWSGAVMGLGLVSAASTTLRHLYAVRNWLFASFRSVIVADRGVRRAGPALTREVPSGEAIQVFADDFGRLGAVFDTWARFCGAVVSFVVVAVILLRGSVLLGVVMLVGGPLLVGSLALVMRPLQRRQDAQRSEAGRLTSIGSDTVTGLRVLRGIGGEASFLQRYAVQSARVRDAGYRLAPVQAVLDAAQVLLPGVFVLVVTAVGAHLALDGQITAGQLVAFYGYTAFLTMPLRTATEFVDKLVRTRVSLRRLIRLLATPADHPAGVGSAAAPSDLASGDLCDPASGVRVAVGRLTALVSARPEDTAALAARLGRVAPGRHGVTWGTTSLDDLDIARVRRHIVVGQADPHVFSGPVRAELLPGAQDIPDADERIHAALAVANAEDVLDGVDGGLDGVLEERARALSGGQRQRLALTRALLRDPEVLVLVEPTSAVDAHTEARIGERLARHRSGRTTVVATASPLLLDHADVVTLVVDGTATVSGRHRDLLRTSSAYRDVVERGGED